MMTTATPHIVRVQVSLPDAQDRGHGITGVLVEPVWQVDGEELDRPVTGGWWVIDHATAGRLMAALLDGAVHESAEVVRDIYGHTYVQANTMRVMGRYMDKDLQRLGY